MRGKLSTCFLQMKICHWGTSCISIPFNRVTLWQTTGKQFAHSLGECSPRGKRKCWICVTLFWYLAPGITHPRLKTSLLLTQYEISRIHTESLQYEASNLSCHLFQSENWSSLISLPAFCLWIYKFSSSSFFHASSTIRGKVGCQNDHESSGILHSVACWPGLFFLCDVVWSYKPLEYKSSNGIACEPPREALSSINLKIDRLEWWATLQSVYYG